MFRIFIGWDSRFPEPADVLAYSLRKHSSIELDMSCATFARLQPDTARKALQFYRLRERATAGVRR